MREDTTETVLTAKPASYFEPYERQRKGTRQLLLARVFFFASGAVVSAILARKLGAIDYGIYGVVISLVLWFEILTNAGVSRATSKLIADRRHDPAEVEHTARALLLIVSLPGAAVCWFLAPAMANLMSLPNGEVLLRIAIIDVPFGALYVSYEGILYGHRRFGAVAAAYVVYGMAKLASVVALIALGFSVELALIVSVISTVLVCIVFVVCYGLGGVRPTLRIVRDIAAIAGPTGLYLVAAQVLLNLDLWSLKSLWRGGGEVVGQYVASANLAKVLTLIPAIQSGVLLASVAWAVTSAESMRARIHIQEATRFALIVGVGVGAMLVFDASEVLSVAFSSTYAAGERFLGVQLAGYALYSLLDVFAISLVAAGDRWFVTSTVSVTVPLVWLSNYLLIPRVGAIGAAISMLIGMAFASGVTGACAYRRFGPVIRPKTMFRVLISAVAVALVGAALQVRGPWILAKIALLGVLYLVVLYAQGEITESDFGLRLKRASRSA